MKKFLLAAVLLLVATAANATDTPLASLSRLSFAAGAQRTIQSVTLSNPTSAWEVGLFGSYKLTNHVNLIAADVWNYDSKENRASVGLRLVIYRGGK